jgi:hypothetical protein
MNEAAQRLRRSRFGRFQKTVETGIAQIRAGAVGIVDKSQ